MLTEKFFKFSLFTRFFSFSQLSRFPFSAIFKITGSRETLIVVCYAKENQANVVEVSWAVGSTRTTIKLLEIRRFVSRMKVIETECCAGF